MKFFNIPKREEGQGLVEYALVLVLVAIVVIAILTMLGSSIVLVYAQVIGGFTGQTLSGSEKEGIVISGGGGVDTGGGTCELINSDVSVVLTQDGSIVTDTIASILFSFGGGTASGTVTIGSSGVGELSLSAHGSCPADLRIDSWSQ